MLCCRSNPCPSKNDCDFRPIAGHSDLVGYYVSTTPHAAELFLGMALSVDERDLIEFDKKEVQKETVAVHDEDWNTQVVSKQTENSST